MKDDHSSEKLVLVLNRGEEIIESVLGFCQANNIAGGWVWGLGAVSDITLAVYDLSTKTYHRREFKGSYELANLTGNVGQLDGKSVAHFHAVVADQEFKSFAGHLDRAIVGATCEIIIEIFEHPISRQFNEEIGLNLIS